MPLDVPPNEWEKGNYMDLAHADWAGFFSSFLGLGLLFLLIALGVAWIALPFVVIGKLGSIDRKVEHARKSAEMAVQQLSAIQKNTADVARFFNEKDVKVEG